MIWNGIRTPFIPLHTFSLKMNCGVSKPAPAFSLLVYNAMSNKTLAWKTATSGHMYKRCGKIYPI